VLKSTPKSQVKLTDPTRIGNLTIIIILCSIDSSDVNVRSTPLKESCQRSIWSLQICITLTVTYIFFFLWMKSKFKMLNRLDVSQNNEDINGTKFILETSTRIYSSLHSFGLQSKVLFLSGTFQCNWPYSSHKERLSANKKMWNNA